MTLTVPRAGVSAGRAARPNLAAPPQDGATVAQLGETMLQVGTALEADRLDRQAQRMAVDLTKDLNDLRLEFEQIGDPDALDAQWPERTAALKAEYLDRADPKLRERFGVQFDDLANRHAFALGSRSIALRLAEREATYADFQDTALTQGAGLDPQSQDYLIEENDRQLEQMVAAGVIDAAQAQTRRAAFRENLDQATAIRLLDDDPQGLIEALEAGEYGGIVGADRAKWRSKAQERLDAQIKAATSAAEKQQKAAYTALGDRLKDIRTRAGQFGYAALSGADLAFLDSAEAQAHEEHGQTVEAVRLFQDYPDLMARTPAELARMEAEARASGPKTPRSELLAELATETAKGWGSDGVSFARQHGLPVPELPEFDPADPAPFERGLAARLSWAEARQDEGYTSGLPVFSADELDRLQAAANPEADPATRLALAETLGRTPAALAQLDAGPVFTAAAGMLAGGAPPSTARAALAGEARQAYKTVPAPTRKAALTALKDVTGDLLSDQPAAEAQVLEAALAIFATTPEAMSADAIDERSFAGAQDSFARAVQRALGASPDASGKLRIGGVQDINGAPTILPPGIHADDAEFAMAAVQAGLDGKIWNDAFRQWAYPPGETRLSDEQRTGLLTRASRTGNPPALGANAADRWDDLRLVPLGGDLYGLSYDSATGPMIVADTDGLRFELDLRALVREVQP